MLWDYSLANTGCRAQMKWRDFLRNETPRTIRLSHISLESLMNNAHEKIFAKGVEEWNQWRKTSEGSEPDLSGINFGFKRFEKWDFSNTHIHTANLSKSEFVECDFSKAQLGHGNFYGTKFRSCNFNSASLENIVASESEFTDCKFESARCRHAKLDRAVFSQCNLGKADFRHAQATESRWLHVRFAEADLSEIHASKAEFEGCDFYRAVAHTAYFAGASITNSRFQYTGLEKAVFANATLTNTDFTNVSFKGAEMQHSRCVGISFVGSILSNANFQHVDLKDANLRGTTMAATTKFSGADVQDCKVDRFSLECLSDYGGLTVGDRMRMEIHDPIAELSASYSGFTQWIHMLALFLFVAPYAWFVIERWTEMQMVHTGVFPSISLIEALGRYVVNGGTNWRSGWFPNYLQLLFVGLTGAYNVLRFMLLWKTKKLELQQQITGLPVKFSLSTGFWATAFRWAQIGFWGNLGVVMLHTIHFLSLRVPILH
jgi:uncharacterized protein YjbI with pentapeptide repeats